MGSGVTYSIENNFYGVTLSFIFTPDILKNILDIMLAQCAVK